MWFSADERGNQGGTAAVVAAMRVSKFVIVVFAHQATHNRYRH